jgi:hypothetical protein
VDWQVTRTYQRLPGPTSAYQDLPSGYRAVVRVGTMEPWDHGVTDHPTAMMLSSKGVVAASLFHENEAVTVRNGTQRYVTMKNWYKVVQTGKNWYKVRKKWEILGKTGTARYKASIQNPNAECRNPTIRPAATAPRRGERKSECRRSQKSVQFDGRRFFPPAFVSCEALSLGRGMSFLP